MDLLKCDVCGGRITVLAGGEIGKCEYCGALYTIERMKEILGIGNQAAPISDERVEQWGKLLNAYCETFDFEEAIKIAKKILEARPEDTKVLKKYKDILVMKDMEIKNNVLVKYVGKASELEIPEGITEIWKGVFENTRLTKIKVPASLTKIGNRAFARQNIRTIDLPEGLLEIGSSAFEGCRELREIVIPRTVRKIADNAFQDCKKLRKAVFYSDDIELRTNYSREAGIFKGCDQLADVICPDKLENIRLFSGTPFEKKIRARWDEEGRCPVCGGIGSQIGNKKVCNSCGNKWDIEEEE